MTTPAQGKDVFQRLLRASGDREWKAELKAILKRDGPTGVVAAMKAWRTSRGSGAPAGDTLLIHQSVAEYFADERGVSLDHLRKALLATRVGEDVAFVTGYPALLFLAGGTRSQLMSEEGKARLLSGSRTSSIALVGETVFGFWSGGPTMGSATNWKEYIRWLIDQSLDMTRPVDALAACVWAHAMYMNEPQLFPEYLPPAGKEFLARYVSGPSDADPKVLPLLQALPMALAESDSEGLLLQQELRRWEALDGQWTKENAFGTWSLRVELARRFQGFQFAEHDSPDEVRDYANLLGLARDLVK